MVRGLLGTAALAAAIVFSAPASAQRWSDPAFVSPASVTVHRGAGAAALVGTFGRDRHERRDWRDRGDRRDGRDGRDGRDFGRGDMFAPWAYDYDFDGNRSFDPDKWNDWWHERPWRAYPRWVQHNQGCPPERMWQGGGMFRCSW